MNETDLPESLESQVERLANFIVQNVPGEPSQSQGAVDTAIRMLAAFQSEKGEPSRVHKDNIPVPRDWTKVEAEARYHSACQYLEAHERRKAAEEACAIFRRRAESAEAVLGEMRGALEQIQRRAAPGHRTMDEMMSDLMWTDDEARRILIFATAEGQEEKP